MLHNGATLGSCVATSLFLHPPRLPLILCVLGEHREAGSDLGHLLAIGDGVEVPLSLEVGWAVFLQ